MPSQSAPRPNNLFNISGKVALVTGGARGIGLFVTRSLVHAGVRVYIASRDKNACDAVATELSQFGECVSLPCDFLRQKDLEAVAHRLLTLEPELHILVNNSGSVRSANFDDFSEADWDDVMDLNVKSTFFVTQKLAPALRRGGRPDDPARVINISSIAGTRTYNNSAYSYMASKAAVNHLTRALGARFAADNITVNAVAPGPMAGGMMERTNQDEAFKQQLESRIPLGRIGSADDMAGVIHFLCAKASAYLTGVVIPLDGGSSTCV